MKSSEDVDVLICLFNGWFLFILLKWISVHAIKMRSLLMNHRFYFLIETHDRIHSKQIYNRFEKIK